MMNDSTLKEDSRHVFHTDRYGCLFSYEGEGGEIKIPEDVKSIGEEAFAYCNYVTGIILPEGIEVIGKKAFLKSGIRNITLPDSLIRIGECAFADTPLEEIVIPDQVKELQEQVFSNARFLKKFRLPKGIKSLNPGMFNGCTSLEEIELPEGLKYIQSGVFRNCTNLKKIILPESLEAVWVQAFEGCSSLREIYLPDEVKAVGYNAFRYCTNLLNARIPKGLKTFGNDVFEGADNVRFTGPGVKDGLIIVGDKIVCCEPGIKKVIIPKSITMINIYDLQVLKDPEVLEIPQSLKYFSWFEFARFLSLKEISGDKGSQAANIAYMLDLKCSDRNGKPFVCKVPAGKWITEPDGTGGVIIRGCKGRAGHTGRGRYTAVIIPSEINGMPVTCIGAEAFNGNDTADAFYIPDTVKRIESRAFGNMGVCRHCSMLFVRMPEGISVAEDAFENTTRFTREEAYTIYQRQTARTIQPVSAKKADAKYAETAADDPLIGTGTDCGYELKPNIWQYFDRLNREERIRELTHSFSVSSAIDGIGWATVKIFLDGDSASFRISYIGSSPADFRRFVNEIESGDSEHFVWASEPGAYPWIIQRRGGILYVTAPHIEKGFFISREEFLLAVSNLTDEWKY